MSNQCCYISLLIYMLYGSIFKTFEFIIIQDNLFLNSSLHAILSTVDSLVV